MWNGILKSKTSENGQLKITVTYVKTGDETSNFDEIYTTGELPSDDWLSKTVSDKIDQLNGLETYSATLQEGATVPAYVAPVPIEPAPVEAQQVEGPMVTETPTEGAPTNG